MLKVKENWYRLVKHEYVRILPLLGIAFLLLFNSGGGSGVILLNIGIVAAIVAVSHLIRRILFPYLELEKYSVLAMGNPIAASIVFFSVCYVLTALMQLIITLIR